MKDNSPTFGQPVVRRADFYQPKNTLKEKVGFGGINPLSRAKAQAMLLIRGDRFADDARRYLEQLQSAMHLAGLRRHTEDTLIAGILEPVFHLKSNGGMFGYPIITVIGERLVEFMETIPHLDDSALDIVSAFHDTFKTVLALDIRSEADERSRQFMSELMDVCRRYFEKRAKL